MDLELGRLSEPGVTDAALVGLLAGVRPHVEHQRRAGAQDLPAHGAQRPLGPALVLPHGMRPHVPLPLEGGLAEAAGEAPLLAVDAGAVLLPAGVAGEGLAAHLALVRLAGQALVHIPAVIHIFLPGNELLLALVAADHADGFLVGHTFVGFL